MNRVEKTYYLIRYAEEQFGPPVQVGWHLVARGESRFPWLDNNLDVEAGREFDILSVDHSPLDGEDHDIYDNHYHVHAAGLEHHGGLSSTEVVAFFDVREEPEAFATIAADVITAIDGPTQ